MTDDGDTKDPQVFTTHLIDISDACKNGCQLSASRPSRNDVVKAAKEIRAAVTLDDAITIVIKLMRARSFMDAALRDNHRLRIENARLALGVKPDVEP